MSWRNSADCYGWAFALLHWLMAVMVFALLGLGLWMTGLDYYHPWYVLAPDWHRGLGVLTGGLLLLRWAWRVLNPPPPPPGFPFVRAAARVVHHLFYWLIAALVVSGYLVSTAKGSPVWVFDWFAVPPLFDGGVENLEDRAGWLHRWLAYGLMGLTGLHALAAFKHQLLDRDGSLWRILGRCHR